MPDSTWTFAVCPGCDRIPFAIANEHMDWESTEVIDQLRGLGAQIKRGEVTDERKMMLGRCTCGKLHIEEVEEDMD